MFSTSGLTGNSCKLLFAIVSLSLALHSAEAALDTLDSRIIADSEEPFSRRINSYDLGIDSSGDVHIIYSKPTGAETADIIYQRRLSGIWQSKQVLSSYGVGGSISTRLVIGDDDVVHVCYILEKLNGQYTKGLYYRTLTGGTAGPEVMVGPGGWHSRMQLDGNALPVFIREDETWPDEVSKLAIFTTIDASTWNKTVLNVPDTVTGAKFRIAGFAYENGNYHVTYGDGSITKPVLPGKEATTRVDGIFHNLHYAMSTDTQNWTASVVDDSGTLYENEFWTSLTLDNSNPMIGMYKYAEYNDEFNTGTSALLAEWNGTGWDSRIITVSSYPETREGMGNNFVVRTPGNYLGAWDFSPDNTYDAYFRGERGNIALYRNGADDDWSERLQVDPFSAEGELKLVLHGDRLHLLVLGDFVDAKLYYREFDLNYIDEQFELLSVRFPWEIFLPAITQQNNK